MSTITWSLLADFDRNGSYDFDLTGYVERPGNGISITRGMGPDGIYRVSSMSVTLSNRSGIFTPDNSASSLYGLMRPGVPIQLTATHNAITYTRWTGYIQSFRPTFRAGQVPMCAIQCYDIAKWIADFRPVNVTASTSRDTDGALTAIATAVGDNFVWAYQRAEALAAAPDFPDRLAAKRRKRAEDEAEKPLEAYRAEELKHMQRNFYGFDPSYHVARHHFVRKTPHSWTPRHLAIHRELGWRVPADDAPD